MLTFNVRLGSYLPSTKQRLFWLRQGFRLLAVSLAGVHAWAAARSHSMNPDGISYLEIGDAYFRGDWGTAINTVWSPLYSWIMGAVMWLFEPPMHLEFPTVHLVNFIIFLAALFAFEFMWSQLAHARQNSRVSAENQIAFPDWAWWSVGYLLIIWVTLSLIQIWAVTPDMLMAVFVFLAAGLLVRIRSSKGTWGTFALLGCVLGLGYLSKAIMLPISVFFMLAAFLIGGNPSQAISRIGFVLIGFMLVAGPFIALISLVNGRFTYGEAGKLTYVRHVNHVVYPHWQGVPPGDGLPVNPSRQIFDDPPIYEFGTPIGGTYPISLNQAYWYEGVTVRIDVVNQIKQLIASTLFYVDLFVYQQAAIFFSLALVYGIRPWGSFSLIGNIWRWSLSLIGILVLLLYAPILVAGRYVGAFVILFWSDLLANARLPYSPISHRAINTISMFMIIFLFVNIALFNLQGFTELTRNDNQQLTQSAMVGPPSWPGEVAESLWELGVNPGDKVAVIGYAFDSFWARLAKVQIVAEMFNWQADPFWLGDQAFQEEVLLTFAGTGASAVVAEHVPDYAQLPGWHQVGNSNYYIYLLTLDD